VSAQAKDITGGKKDVKNVFLTWYKIYNINLDCKIVKLQVKYFN